MDTASVSYYCCVLKQHKFIIIYSPEVRSLQWVLQAQIKALTGLLSFGDSESRIHSFVCLCVSVFLFRF